MNHFYLDCNLLRKKSGCKLFKIADDNQNVVFTFQESPGRPPGHYYDKTSTTSEDKHQKITDKMDLNTEKGKI